MEVLIIGCVQHCKYVQTLERTNLDGSEGRTFLPSQDHPFCLAISSSYYLVLPTARRYSAASGTLCTVVKVTTSIFSQHFATQ